MPGWDDLAEIERRAWALMEGAPADEAARALCRALGRVNAAASVIDLATGRGVAEGYAEMDPALLSLLREEFASPDANPLLATLPRLPPDRLFHAAEQFDMARVRRTRFHAEWWAPTGVREHAGALALPTPDGRVVYVALGCLGARDWLDPDERRFAEAACRSVARALHAVAALAHARAASALAARGPDPCWLLRADRAVLLANAEARAEVASGGAVRLRAGALSLGGPAAGWRLDGPENVRLAALVADACAADGRRGGAAAGSGLVLRRAGGFARLTVAPGPRYRDAGTALATLRPPRPMAWDEGELRRAFGLTGREAEVALALAGGLRAEEAAAALGLAPASVRLYLKRVYGKTGAHGQGPLVALLLRGGEARP